MKIYSQKEANKFSKKILIEMGFDLQQNLEYTKNERLKLQRAFDLSQNKTVQQEAEITKLHNTSIKASEHIKDLESKLENSTAALNDCYRRIGWLTMMMSHVELKKSEGQ